MHARRRLAALALLAALAARPARAQTELCRVYPPGSPHQGCGICGGPGVRLDNGRCAAWSDVVVPDCRALRGEMRDPGRCADARAVATRERGRAVSPPSQP